MSCALMLSTTPYDNLDSTPITSPKVRSFLPAWFTVLEGPMTLGTGVWEVDVRVSLTGTPGRVPSPRPRRTA